MKIITTHDKGTLLELSDNLLEKVWLRLEPFGIPHEKREEYPRGPSASSA